MKNARTPSSSSAAKGPTVAVALIFYYKVVAKHLLFKYTVTRVVQLVYKLLKI